MAYFPGKVSLSQLSTVSFICVLAYGINFWICTYILGAYDNVGGSCIIHLFGACFGIGCTLKASLKGSSENPDNAARYNAGICTRVATAYIHAHTHMRARTHTHKFTHIYKHTGTYTHTHIYIQTQSSSPGCHMMTRSNKMC